MPSNQYEDIDYSSYIEYKLNDLLSQIQQAQQQPEAVKADNECSTALAELINREQKK